MRVMRLMGILNVTPDSFSDGGRHAGVDAARAHAERMVAEGAAWIDVGGESTRPGARTVPVAEELARVLPVVRAVRGLAPVSVDTRRAAVAEAAIDAGATLVNDVSGGADPAMFPLVARAGVGLVIMHSRGEPDTMQGLAAYDDVVGEVWAALDARFDAAVAAGVDPSRILLDPGIGLPKTTAHNLRLLHALAPHARRRPVLVGASRKRFIGELTGQAVAADRVEGSIAVALWARQAGVAVLRVHDVGATARALAVWDAVAGAPA